jgi:nucleoside 2-deoxyribosyltransferase
VGAYAERVDEQIFAEGILQRIFNQINKADVIVADMTGQNPNVFYEVGYTHALNKIVLLLAQNATNTPFDLKQQSHLIYGNSIDKLRTDLVPRLRWAIEEGRRRGRQETSRYQLVVSLRGVELP